ncbi:hypothetical protein TcCL_ESM08511 [Trypanosoma cruzi]|nr:hypothetical protein TcCL_ESM08511 [Trypanosoma cruzi]
MWPAFWVQSRQVVEREETYYRSSICCCCRLTSRKEPLNPLSLTIKGSHAWDASCLVWHEEQQRVLNVANAGLTVQCGEYNTLDLPEDRRAHFSPPVADTILGQPHLCRTEHPFGERRAAPPTCWKNSQKEAQPTCGTLPCNFDTLTARRAFLPESVRPIIIIITAQIISTGNNGIAPVLLMPVGLLHPPPHVRMNKVSSCTAMRPLVSDKYQYFIVTKVAVQFSLHRHTS